MGIVVHLDEIMAEQGITVTRLAQEAGISRVNMSHFKTGQIKAVRFSTLAAVCRCLGCQPGDILEFVDDDDARSLS
ncbi:MAG: helix-turn-helix domain-containing protein [Coriobacteriales bacterium]